MLCNTMDRFTTIATVPSARGNATREDGVACFDLEFSLERLSPGGMWVRATPSTLLRTPRGTRQLTVGSALVHR